MNIYNARMYVRVHIHIYILCVVPSNAYFFMICIDQNMFVCCIMHKCVSGGVCVLVCIYIYMYIYTYTGVSIVCFPFLAGQCSEVFFLDVQLQLLLSFMHILCINSSLGSSNTTTTNQYVTTNNVKVLLRSSYGKLISCL
uniref:Uncharacterized protein n=2 Tax=Anopheles triannulatus TaxID=58253 RepID=A0A2M4AYL5_9DIPT